MDPSIVSSGCMVILFGAVYLVIFMTALVPIQEPDFWWHLASGRFILAHHAVPFTDPFSWTARGTPWVDTYWAYEALLAFGYNRVGVTGLVVLNAFIVLGIFLILNRRMLLQGVSWHWRLAALVVMLLGGAPAGGYWGAQASLVTLLFFSALVWHWDVVQRQGWQRSLWIWPLLFMLWANFHRGFVIGLVVAAIYILDEAYWSRRWVRNILWLLACVLAPLINPYGWTLFIMIRDDLTLSSKWIAGWGPPTFAHLRLYSLVLLSFAVVLLQHFRSKDWRNMAPMVVGALLAAGSFRHLVYVPYFMVFTLRWIAAHAAVVPTPWHRYIEKWVERLAVCAFCILLGFLAYARVPRTVRFDGPKNDVFAFIQAEKIAGPFYNDYSLGGQWLWALGQDPPVFIDGRYPAVRGYMPVMRDVIQGRQSAANWRSFLQHYGIQAALVTYQNIGPLPSLFQAMFPREEWALVYWDDVAALYLRRGKNAQVISKAESSQLWPDITAPAFVEQIHRASVPDRLAMAKELYRNCVLHPSSGRTLFLMNLFLLHHQHAVGAD